MTNEYVPQQSNDDEPDFFDRYFGKDKQATSDTVAELEQALEDIWGIARENHLDPFPTSFSVVPANIMNQIGSYGLPDRFSHWTFGRQYRQMQTEYNHGMSRIYELVINSNPSQAFLLENNNVAANKFVMAHVLGHTDFFKNNWKFANTNRNMPEIAAANAARIHEFESIYGTEVVEELLDSVMVIQEYIDPYVINRPYADEEMASWVKAAKQNMRPIPVLENDEFADLIGPPKLRKVEREMGRIALNIPPEPDSDIMGFVRNYAPYLDSWQREVIDIVRDESLYFYPQRRTKIMNEGWAAYWHKRIMREMSAQNKITSAEDESWWRLHSGVVAPNPRSLNPYYLGMKMYEYLEDYYNGHLTEQENQWLVDQGRPIYPAFCGDLKDSPAAKKLRNVMMSNDDQSFLRNYFDKNIADRMEMYVYEKRIDSRGNETAVISSRGWEEVRRQLVGMFDNAGTPRISVVDGDYNSAGELFLQHSFDGRELDREYIKKTLPHIYRLWQRPVLLETASKDGNVVIHKFDGKNLSFSTVHGAPKN